MLPTISNENKLQSILDFKVCKKLLDEAIKNNEPCVILCPHYSINIFSKYDDSEELNMDLDELEEYLDGHYIEVSDYDDLIITLPCKD